MLLFFTCYRQRFWWLGPSCGGGCFAQVPVCPSRKSYIQGLQYCIYLLHRGLSPTGSCVEDVQSPHLSVFSV